MLARLPAAEEPKVIEPATTSTVASPVWLPTWLPLLAAFGGFAFASFNDYVKDRRTASREREARDAAGKLQQVERRIAFQRQTLLDLQESAHKMAQVCGTIFFMRHARFSETGIWGEQDIPTGLNEDLRQSVSKTVMLSVRVRSDSVRDEAVTFKGFATGSITASNKTDAQKSINDMSRALGPLHESIGAVLRKLDDDEEAGVGE